MQAIQMIDPKDLQKITLADFSKSGIGGVFYKKEDDGRFSMCKIHKEELKDPVRAEVLRRTTKKYLDSGLLYKRINRPWEAFE